MSNYHYAWHFLPYKGSFNEFVINASVQSMTVGAILDMVILKVLFDKVKFEQSIEIAREGALWICGSRGILAVHRPLEVLPGSQCDQNGGRMVGAEIRDIGKDEIM